MDKKREPLLKPKKIMKEEFRDVPGYEGVYEVSDWGRIRRNGKILRPGNLTTGYLFVNLCKNGISKKFLIHRLVAYVFIPNPKNLPQVNHKDENKSNNTVDNLEWCTRDYNMNYGTIKERISEKMSKPVLQYDLLGNFIREWPSATKVEEELGIDHSHISRCCLGKLKSTGGFVWKHKNY